MVAVVVEKVASYSKGGVVVVVMETWDCGHWGERAEVKGYVNDIICQLQDEFSDSVSVTKD